MLITITSETLTDIKTGIQDDIRFSAYEEEWDVNDEHTRGRTTMRTGVQGMLFLSPLIFQLLNIHLETGLKMRCNRPP